MKVIEPYVIEPFVFHPADPAVGKVFESLKTMIGERLPGVQIDHIGSTAIPGMPGKNIVNLLISCPTDDYGESLGELGELGFMISPIHKNEPAKRPMRVGSILYNGRRYNIHVHLTSTSSNDYHNALFFRDYLIDHPDVANEYAEVKKRAIGDGHVNPKAYHQAKSEFIRSILEKRTEQPY